MRLRREIKIACGVLYADVHWLKKGPLIHNINIKVRKLLKQTWWQKRNFILHFDGKYDNVLDIYILLSDKKKFDWQIPHRFLSANLFTFCHNIWQALFTFFYNKLHWSQCQKTTKFMSIRLKVFGEIFYELVFVQTFISVDKDKSIN